MLQSRDGLVGQQLSPLPEMQKETGEVGQLAESKFGAQEQQEVSSEPGPLEALEALPSRPVVGHTAGPAPLLLSPDLGSWRDPLPTCAAFAGQSQSGTEQSSVGSPSTKAPPPAMSPASCLKISSLLDLPESLGSRLKQLMGASQVAPGVKNLHANAGDAKDTRSVPGSGRPPGGGHGSPLWCSFLGSPMDRVAWRAVVHRLHKAGHD